MNEKHNIPNNAEEDRMREAAAEMRRRVLLAQASNGSSSECNAKSEKHSVNKAKSKTNHKAGYQSTARVRISKIKKPKCDGVKRLKDFADDLKYDIDAIMERDPAARSRAEAVLLYSGFHALAAHRVAHALNNRGAHFTARLISQATKVVTGIEIHPGATIGKGLFIDHGSGVVIGETAIIGDNCTIYQGVTLGGTGKDTGKRHPTLCDNVMVGSGAKVLGNFTVGSGAKIAAGAVVLGEVPENSTAVGIPARVVRQNGEKVTNEVDLDQVHIPDPVSIQMTSMQEKIDELSREIARLRGDQDESTESPEVESEK